LFCDVCSAISAAGVALHARHDKVDVVVTRVAVNRRDPPEVTAGLCRERSNGAPCQALEIEAPTLLGGDDQAGNGSTPIEDSAVARAEQLRLGTGY
jgi:hypothetical protein